MAIPTYDKVMLPLLQFADEQNERISISQALEAMIHYFGLSDDEVEKLLPSGTQTVFYNRLTWAKWHLTKAKLLVSTGRGKFEITDRGRRIVAENPQVIDRNYLNQFVEFRQALSQSSENATPEEVDDSSVQIGSSQTPQELVDTTFIQMRQGLVDDLLDVVLNVSPIFFERLVLDLLLAMGYGSTLDSGEHLGKSGDGGVDGIIREDKLGLESIYIQAKRYTSEHGIGRPDIQGFVGSLMGVGATKGVFITTSYFSKYAVEYAQTVPNLRVILIDGRQLANLMIEHNVGVSVQKTYIVKQIDENYFPD